MGDNTETIRLAGQDVVVRRASTVIVGAGAGGMGCAVQLVRGAASRGVQDPAERRARRHRRARARRQPNERLRQADVLQDGHEPARADTAEDFARTLTAFGCCHGDTALVEGVCSLRGFYNLVEAGVPFPHDPFGAFVGYKTDHDPCERATSAGPKTSRFMSECLQAERRANWACGSSTSTRSVRFITAGEGDARGASSRWCASTAPGEGRRRRSRRRGVRRGQLGPRGRRARRALPVHRLPARADRHSRPRVAGGARGLQPHRVAVRARVGQVPLERLGHVHAGRAANLQHRRRRAATQREFLAEYFDSMSAMATNIFLKGYQWPFDAQRIADAAVVADRHGGARRDERPRAARVDGLHAKPGRARGRRRRAGRLGRVRRGGPRRRGGRSICDKAGATQGLPIDRLRHMNPPAIEIYAENGIDLTREPLEIAVCAQHLNGGFCVDKWWRVECRADVRHRRDGRHARRQAAGRGGVERRAGRRDAGGGVHRQRVCTRRREPGRADGDRAGGGRAGRRGFARPAGQRSRRRDNACRRARGDWRTDDPSGRPLAEPTRSGRRAGRRARTIRRASARPG